MSINRVGSGCGSAIGGIIFLLVGVGMLGFGGWSYMNTRNQMESWGNVQGEVVAFSYYSDSEGGRSTVPVIEFTTTEGDTLTAEPYQERNTTVDVNGYDVGDEVEVYYNPENPRDMFINDFMHVWFIPTLMGGMGGLFSVIGLLWTVGALFGALLFGRRVIPQPAMGAGMSGPPPTISI